MASLKPIVHGYSDPCEIPVKCKNCTYYDRNGKSFPRCTKREDGKFVPEIEFTCFNRRIARSGNSEKSK